MQQTPRNHWVKSLHDIACMVEKQIVHRHQSQTGHKQLNKEVYTPIHNHEQKGVNKTSQIYMSTK